LQFTPDQSQTFSGAVAIEAVEAVMIRTAALFAVAGVVALLALRLFLGVFGGIVGMLFGLAFLLVKLLAVLGILYFVLTLISPETAKKVKDRVARGPA